LAEFNACFSDAPPFLECYINGMNLLPSTKTMYRALVNKDSSFEGIFYVGVKTTGIFCRPTCPAKKPKLANVEFFPSTNQALYGGYRPCLRCKPLDKEQAPPELVRQLSLRIEETMPARLGDRDLRKMGIDPSTARRQFIKYYGMTFHAYQRARRMGMALKRIREGENVIGAQIETGFESASGFWAAFKNVFGVAPAKATAVDYLVAKWFESPLGAMVGIAGSEGLYLLEFVDRRGLEKEILVLRKRTGRVIVPGENKHLERIGKELKSYFNGTGESFSVPLVVLGSPFEQSVWGALQTIPPGTTRSYIDIARTVKKPAAQRAVGTANGKNCIAIVIPCHRVIKSDGSLSGYGGGVWRKRWLIDHERNSFARAANS
jgi:AraC family transcriptional regulator of adaptative response/methylated-DNA-[protein]-cysteine methyltransferase